MKKIWILLGLISLSCYATAQKPNTFVNAAIAGIPAGSKVYYRAVNGSINDSVQATDKGFDIALHTPDGEADLFQVSIGKLSASSSGNNLAFIFLQKGKLTIKSSTGSFKDAVFSGGDMAKYYNAYKNKPALPELTKVLNALREAQTKNDTAQSKLLMPQYTALNAQQLLEDKKWAIDNITSPVIVYPLFFGLRGRLSFTTLDSILQLAPPPAKNNMVVKAIEKSINTDKLTGIGRPALEFSQTDTAGKMVSLKDFRGKYVLVDFWASWCGPCRVENPHVVSAYQQYKNKNFTVLGVSFDRPGDHAKWMKAIHDDGLTWAHVSDLKFWDNAVGRMYDIRSIPSNVLVDPNGVIVGKKLRGEGLDKKLHELLGEPELDEGTFVIKGEMEGAKPDTWFYIHYMNNKGTQLKDSIKLYQGRFSYVGKTAAPQQATVYFKEPGENISQRSEGFTSFFVEQGVIALSGNVDAVNKLVVKGGKTQAELKAFQDKMADMRALIDPISKKYGEENLKYIEMRKAGKSETELEKFKEDLTALRESMSPYQREIQKRSIRYFNENPDSYITLNNLRYYVNSMKPDELDAIYNKMSNKLKATPNGKDIAAEIKKLRSGSPGSMATNFSGTDINGKPLQLTDLKGKYVLLDFWASWCVPCRKGNPHLLQLYSKYQKKGFEIVGVSDDDSNHDAWRKAVDKDGIGVWKHVLRGLKRTADGFDRSEDKSEAYGIHTLPTKILIDPSGKIIGRYGGGGEDDEAMDKKLEKVFGK